MFGRKKRAVWDKMGTLSLMEELIGDLRLKKKVVEPTADAAGQSAALQRSAAEWIERSVCLLREGAEMLRISLPDPRRDATTEQELSGLLAEISGVLGTVALIWSSAQEHLYPLALSVRDTIKTYCTV
jgi:hypothetical protein